jgi:protein-disulfide isomerase
MSSPRAILLFSLSIGTLAGAAERALEGLPGLDFSRLSGPAQKELAAVLTDEFDYCGRPLTLHASLKKGDSCKHLRRLVGLAATYANEGQGGQDIINALAKYNATFAAKRSRFKVDERMCKGSKEAKVTLVEFADFECPHCASARQMLQDFLKARPSARVCYLPFPLSGHANSLPAAQAALFARDANKFWLMHDGLFDNQLTLSDGTIKELAKKFGLDGAGLSKAMTSGKYQEELEALKALGKNAGVESTPTVYVNGRKLTLNISVDALNVAFDDEIDWLQSSGAWTSN